ncbi:hypothetical protein B5X24_HaOG207634 [Helicoverpa armigera]|uniref:Helicase ATP-binding domain-containing protein n=1 Tax=Helicoverpa armigera TaxID=29058 RepID=A0A2W1BHQ6_HELAM|nr:hypothetical protein B5X24_HaOG207634 [Helicoverpa armigera]
MVEKAKQEAYVAGRVAELARAGLWAERRLPRVLEPPRTKSHWDYLLEEMAWLAQDFAHERKWKKQAAKKCARAVQKYFQDKAIAAQKAEKAQEIQLRKIAAFAAKEIRTFWSNVEKLVEWKRVRRVERARKQALDEQLSYIRRVEAAAVLAASLQPTGTTLSETAVATPVPRLLRHVLREYQHVGLHWLATMYARGLNGILADEMGLGKTVQTIALLAHLAQERGDWGPHLVVAPTSVVLNWEMEFKKWCPAFKILTYYGTIKERKMKRVGWTKANSFHVCITSYKLVVQDHQSFRRKRWKYLILDEAQNIKNFKSQRWQMLLNFQTERRLLLTGTPLQNSLLELWSLMHFLMPDVFASHSEFREWFSEVAGIADGSNRYNEALVRRLHEVLRPFLLRRLKQDVERQMPRKYEHVLLCRLSKRQRFLYDDFMSRAKTKESLASGHLLSVINVLMQLRKVCNHPDLFEPRPVSSPLQEPGLRLVVPALALLAGPAERLGSIPQ